MKSYLNLKFSFLFLIYLFFRTFCDDFSVINGILDGSNGDVIAAFGDFNADKLIDIFVINRGGLGVDVLLTHEKSEYERQVLLPNGTISHQQTISGVMVADFDGNVLMDVLVSVKNPTLPASSTSPVQLILFWGNETGLDTDNPYRFNNSSFSDEPILFDFNADMMPDLLTKVHPSSENIVWQSIRNERNFSEERFPNSFDLRVPHSSAFVDLNKDYNTDLIVTNEEKEFLLFFNNDFTNATIIEFNVPFDVVGQSSFADFNQDGYIDHVVPVCKKSQSEGRCTDSVIYMRDGKNRTQWIEASDNSLECDFVSDASSQLPPSLRLEVPLTLRVGDYDMDGYPDLLAVMYCGSSGTKPILLQNVPNGSAERRKFSARKGLLPSAINSSVLATFYDYAEDGMLDILVTSIGSGGNPFSILIKNNLALDTCFLKVTVISGLCPQKCNNGRNPYGVNVAGPTVRYETIQANGNFQTSSAGQLSQSAHFALQLPFVSFGLGQMPNFVDFVGVGIPTPLNNAVNRTKSWTQIIPNAQLIVNPNPINEPSSWRMQLFVVPSQQIYLTGIALLSTCVLLALIVGVLLWHERREDKLEKKNESQKFHFDAM